MLHGKVTLRENKMVILWGKKFVADLGNVDTCFHLIWCSIGIESNENKAIIF